jgi:hypothetical protein
VILRAPSFPCCVDWLPDGRLLVVSARDGLLLRTEPDCALVTHGDVSGLSDPPAGNELVVDGRGNAYLNGGGFNLTPVPAGSALPSGVGVGYLLAEGFQLGGQGSQPPLVAEPGLLARISTQEVGTILPPDWCAS